MLKSVEKCGMVKSNECSGHVESSQNCDFSRVNSFHDVAILLSAEVVIAILLQYASSGGSSVM